MKHIFFLCLVVLLSINCFASDEKQEQVHLNWLTDLDEGLKVAQKEQKLLLVDFTGSDWCYWCIKLDKEVFSKKEFKNYAKENFVLVKLDFPRKNTQSEEQKKKNKKWFKKYGLRGYPSVLILDSKANLVEKTGYQSGGPVKYVEFLNKIVQKYHEKQKDNETK